MIIQLFLDFLFGLFDLLTKVINIPSLPSEVDGMLSQAFGYFEFGFSFIGNFIPLGYFGILFGVILAIDVGVSIYHFVMWILRKIPLAGIS